MEEGEERLSTIERAEEALRAGNVLSEDAAVGMGESGAVCEGVGEGEVFVLPVTGAEGAEGGITSGGEEAVGVIGMKAMTGDSLKDGRLQVARLNIKAA